MGRENRKPNDAKGRENRTPNDMKGRENRTPNDVKGRANDVKGRKLKRKGYSLRINTQPRPILLHKLP